MSKRLILGSGSPRRKEILSFFSYPFEQISPSFIEESVLFEGDPISYANTLSSGKGKSLASKFPKAVILAADTVVYKEGKIYNKPSNDEEAISMLKELNGSWHQVFTSLAVGFEEEQEICCTETRVLFDKLSENELKAYHAAFKATDKAGGYGIQMAGSVIVKRIEGCFYNVMGLPIGPTCHALKKAGIDLWHYLI